MDKFIDKLLKLPKWNAIVVLVIYALLASEMTLTTMSFTFASMGLNIPEDMMGIMTVIMFIAGFIGVVISWVLVAAIFFVVAMILSGKGKFKDWLFCSTYFYVITIAVLPFVIYLLGDIELPKSANALELVEALKNNENYKLATIIQTLSSVVQYVFFFFVIRRIFSLSNWKSALCCIIPFVLFVGLSLILQ